MGKVRPAELMVRTSERTCWTTCRQKWEWAYVLRLKSNQPSSPLTFGTYWHALMERWYTADNGGIIRHPAPAALARRMSANYERKYGHPLPRVKIGTASEEDGEEDRGTVAALDLALDLIAEYQSVHKGDPRYRVIANELLFQVDITENRKYLYTYVGTMDGVWEDLDHPGRLFGVERKTGSGLDPFGAPVELDEQSGSYLTYGNIWLQQQGILPEGQSIHFVLFDRVRKALKDSRPRNEQGLALNKNGSVSKRQPQPRVKREPSYRGEQSQIMLMDRVADQASEMLGARNGQVAIYKNPDRHCGWCEFREMCEVHEEGGDWQEIAKYSFTGWDPYSAHSIKEERNRG